MQDDSLASKRSASLQAAFETHAENIATVKDEETAPEDILQASKSLFSKKAKPQSIEMKTQSGKDTLLEATLTPRVSNREQERAFAKTLTKKLKTEQQQQTAQLVEDSKQATNRVKESNRTLPSVPITANAKKPSSSDPHHDPPLALFFEDYAPGGVLTPASLDRIARHRYVSGKYTWLDNFLNHMWTWLTEFLPRWLAPNLVTVIGASHALASFLVSWQVTRNDPDGTHPWLLLFNAYCLFVSYTLDCMDGKQARRTHSSSPLGQLFDHGLDGLCVIAHISAVHCWLRGFSSIRLQMVLQFAFLQAQWEEFFTHVLPHGTGQLGVTEVNYGMALLSLVHGIYGLIHEEGVDYTRPVSELVITGINAGLVPSRLLDVVLDLFVQNDRATLDNKVDEVLGHVQLRDVVFMSWIGAVGVLSYLSAGRVISYLRNTLSIFKAFSYLLSPLVLVGFALLDEFVEVDPTVLANSREALRWKGLGAGLLLSHLTIKIIVFSMARQSVALVQWDIVPVVLAAIAALDPRLTDDGHVLLWRTVSVIALCRLVSWDGKAIQQITERLGIETFRIRSVISV